MPLNDENVYENCQKIFFFILLFLVIRLEKDAYNNLKSSVL